jgi:hypothetical protein
MSRAHATLAPSASHRWVHCPGSVRASAGLPDKSTSFAAEGTAAHFLAEHCLQGGTEPEKFAGQIIDTGYEKTYFMAIGYEADGQTKFEVNDEMIEGVQLYLDVTREIADECEEFEVEQHLVISEDIFGTGDVVAFNHDKSRLIVTDFKYGRGIPVEPKENTQLVLYAIGALKRYHNRGVKEIELVVVQPRCPHPAGPVRRWIADPATLLDMEADLMDAAAKTKEADPPLAAGDWCKFCKAAPTCDEFRKRAQAIAEAEFTDTTQAVVDVKTLTPDQLATALAEVDILESWCRRLREHAHGEALHGRGPTGWKLVAKRAVRKWRDEAEAAEVLQMLTELTQLDLYADPKMLSPAQMEKLLPKKQREKVIGPLVTKQSSGVVLAPADDPRPLVVPDAENEFSDTTVET